MDSQDPVYEPVDQTIEDPVAIASRLKDYAHSSEDPIVLPLHYARQIEKEVLEDDQLVVVARGLGLHWIVAAVILVIDAAGTHRNTENGNVADNESLVLIVGASDRDRQRVNDHLETLTPKTNIPTRGIQVLNSDVDPGKRQKLYAQGGVYAVTSEILTVDMLNGTVKTPEITGLVIMNAHQANDTNKMGFVVNLFRADNKHGFIKAFTDRPEAVSTGINGLSNRMKYLGVPKVSLWPRFHVLVSKSLPKRLVTEVIVEVSPSMVRIQELLSTLIPLLISDIKRKVGNVIDTEHWNLDAALTTNLAQTIRINLNNHWHKLSYEARQTIHQISQLQELQRTLTELSPVAFYKLLISKLRATSSDNSPPIWALHEAADDLLALAYKRIEDEEDLPKWPHLADLLRSHPGKRVLLMCKSDKVLGQLYGLAHNLDGYAHEQKELFIQETLLQAYLKPPTSARTRREEIANQARASNPSKRRRVRGGAQAASGPTRADVAAEKEPESVVREEINLTGDLKSPTPEVIDLTNAPSSQPLPQPFKEEEITLLSQDENVPGTMVITTYDAPEILYRFKPEVVIMHELDLEFTREFETYQAITASDTELYLMYYQQSVEELQFLTEVRKEKDAFTDLIREKANMPMVINDVPERETGMRVTSTRIGGRLQHQIFTEQPRVIVDAREFRSELPHLIWQQNMEVVPISLLVGDYIVTPKIAVERKSLSDLRGSFIDGRLVTQLKEMFKYYETPMLLIEFSNATTFSFETFEELRTHSVKRELQDKLVLLIVNFPKLKIIWSASPRHTAEIFQSLKTNQEEPDPQKAVEAGKRQIKNTTAMDMLRQIPGITARNAQILAEKLTCLQDLATMSFEDLNEILGPEAARKVTNFLDRKFVV